MIQLQYEILVKKWKIIEHAKNSEKIRFFRNKLLKHIFLKIPKIQRFRSVPNPEWVFEFRKFRNRNLKPKCNSEKIQKNSKNINFDPVRPIFIPNFDSYEV